jgi:hypothetical protein
MKNYLLSKKLFLMACLLLSSAGIAQEIQMTRPDSGGELPEYNKDDGEWIGYWETVNENALGLGGDGSQWFAAVRWMPEDLDVYEGWYVSRIRVFINDLPNNGFVTIWQGDIDNPMLILQQEMDVAAEEWVEVELVEPHPIDISQELWIGWEIGDPGDGIFPAAFDTSNPVTGYSDLLQFGENPWGFAATYGFDVAWNVEAFVVPMDEPLPPADPVEMFTILNKTGADLPAEIGEGGNARSAALYLNRYVIVPSREGGPEVWVWDAHNPEEAPFALDPGDGYEGGLFPVNYVQTVGEHIYVSNMSLGSDITHPFKVYRWDGLDATPELILSADGAYGRLGDSFSIIGDPAGNGHIIAHVNSGGEGQRTFRKWNFVDGVNQNPDAPELITIEGDHNMNSYGVFNTIEGEDDLFLITGNVMGIGIADINGQVHSMIDSEIVPTRTMDPRVFYHNGNRYLSYVVNKEWDTTEGSYYDVIDISMGDNVVEAFSMITTMDDLDARRAHSVILGGGAAFLSGTHQVSHTDEGEIMLLSHVVACGFVLESTAPLATEPEAPENLIHYWHFNDENITEDDLVPSDYSAVGEGIISYPGTGDGYMDFRSHRPDDPVSNFNLKMGQEPDQGAILRVRNPANTRELIVAAPSTGYENLVVTFAATRSGSGGQEQEFYFSADHGTTWTQVGDAYDVFEHDPDADNFGYIHKVIDLTSYPEVNDNPELHFRIMAVGEGSDGSSGNQRFDNLSLEGDPVSFDLELVHYWHFNDENITEEDLVPSDFSAIGTGVISYPGTGDGYMDFRSHRPDDPVSNFNLRMGQEPDQGAILRVRNPANTRELIIAAPSTGYENLVVTFAATRSGSGGQEQEFYFSADNGDTWTQVGDAYDIFEHDPEADNFGYIHKVIDLSGYEEVNNNHELHFRIMSVGEGSDGSSGNQRFDNFTLDGVPVDEVLPPVALNIVAVNQGNPVYVDEAFSLTVQTLNDEGNPAIADADYVVNLSLAAGSGNLGGNLTGIIEEGSTSVIIEGLTYDAAESGVSITAAAEGLEPATSEAFEVWVRTYNLSLTMNIAGAGVLSGEGDYEEGAEVTIEAVANEGYEFVNWTIDGEVFATDALNTFNMPAEDLEIRANFDEEITGDPMLIHYFHFNEMDGSSVTEVHSDYSIGVLSAMITYPGTGDGYMDARTHRDSDPVSNFNLRQGQEPDQGAVLRARNPANTRELLFEVPSTGFERLVVMYAATRTENGGQEQRFEYSPDGGTTWVQPIDDYAVPFIEDEEGIYLHVTIDLTDIDEVDDNPDLHFRILSVGEGNDNPSGNQRFDNFTVDGLPLDDDVSVINIDHLPGIFVSPNPARGPVNISVDEPGTLIRVFSVSGAVLLQTTVRGEQTTIDTSNFDSGLYIIQGIAPSTGVPTNVRLIVK